MSADYASITAFAAFAIASEFAGYAEINNSCQSRFALQIH